MTKKNILLISPFFYPEPISTGKFNTDLVVKLAELGHKITVLCYHPFYPEWKIQKTNKSIDKITIIRGGKNIRFSKKTIFRRLILEASFAFFILKNIKKHQKNKDIIIPVFPPSLMFYSLIPFLNKNIRKIGLVHDLQEIYSSNKKGISQKIISFFISKVEKKCFNSCDKLVFLSEEMKNEAKKLYQLKSTKLEVQYPFITISNEVTNGLNKLFNPNKLNIVYSGALGEKQNPLKLFKFFNFASEKIKNSEFHFFSRGQIFNELKTQNNNKKIKFHDLVSKEYLKELYMKSDTQIVPQLKNTSKGSLPSKLPNLLFSGCKILIVTDKDSEIDVFFKNQKLNKVINSWELEIMLRELKKVLISENKKEHQIKIAESFFTINRMIDKIIN